ncbi:MAG: bifunctional phosphopantothenoylcysteine decarboxylase/phosphopantothenate--cysteine ligase CoaBC [Gemmatimonadetes bacterium]|nr:MAG: bifunctional phosphopantothenoylcysteine decarboxylase/phosphopantothenate--cysteine ligase CoaBC [Gemmatimonadota bacterium]
MAVLSGKKVLLGISGGIAAYKAVEVASRLTQLGAEVRTVMTKNATEFVTPLTFEAVTGQSVACDLFPLYGSAGTRHIDLARWAEVIALVPATANLMGKIVNGLADDLLTTLIMASTTPIFFAPAMNVQMWQNPIVQRNLDQLKAYGYRFIEPDSGWMACREQGSGRLAEPARIIGTLRDHLLQQDDLRGKTVLVTAGPTQEPLDPVRYLTNHSSGKMGYALAHVAALRGAEVILISGPTSLEPPRGVKVVRVQTAVEMSQVVLAELPRTDIVLMAAAVADYRPVRPNAQKIKKTDQPLTVEMERNPDILRQIQEQPPTRDRFVVGFALETENVMPNAIDKLDRKNLDMIVANDASQPGAGFQTDTNIVTLIDRWGKVEHLPQMDKFEVAQRILERVVERVAKPVPAQGEIS